MSECIDKRIGDMLFAYELDLLDSKDERLVELHLLSCEHCLQRAKRFSAYLDTIRDDAEAREVIRREAAESEPAAAGRAKRQRWPAVIRTVAVAAAAVVILLLRPWRIEFHPSHEVFAEENRIAVMNFRNLAERTDSLQWGQVVSSLLTSDLSESRSLQVVSSQRMIDLVRDEADPAAPPDKQQAMELAHKAGARWIVEGDILQMKPNPVVVARLVDARDGTVKSSQKMEAEPNQTLYAIVDPLTEHITASVLQPSWRATEPDLPVTQVTTASAQALQDYLDGLALYAQFYFNEAAEKFLKALSQDSTFAMAYYYLSRCRTGAAQVELLDKAERFSVRAGRGDRLRIASRMAAIKGDRVKAEELLLQMLKEFPDEKEAHYELGVLYYNDRRFQEAVSHFTEAIRLDPRYKVAYNQLAYAYVEVGNNERAIWAIDQYVALAPGDANAYDSRGEIMLYTGSPDNAGAEYEKALAIKPDYYPSLHSLGDCLLFSRKYDRADSCYQALADAPIRDQYTVDGRCRLAISAARRGQFQRAVDILDKYASPDLALGKTRYQVLYLKALLLVELGRNQEARSTADSARAVAMAQDVDTAYAAVEHIYLLTRIGDLVAAEQEFGQLEKSGLEPEPAKLHLPLARACIEMAKGNHAAAKILLSSIFDLTPNTNGRYHYPVRVFHADCCLFSGDLAAATELYKSLIVKTAARRLYWSLLDIRVMYHLGMAYDRSGKTREAGHWYEGFLSYWGDSPHQIADVKAARERLAQLK